jgi:hypothetical protein
MTPCHYEVTAESTMNAVRLFLFVALATLFARGAAGQVDGGGTNIIIPVVAATASFKSEITVKDESGTSHNLSMTFYEAQTSASPGAKACSAIALAPYQVTTVSLASQCGLAGSHHGFVILKDAGNKWFFAFSRTQNPQGIGFSVEGYPIGHIGGGDPFSEIGGIKRKAATASSPAFQTNCFVVTLDDPVTYAVSVDDGSGSGTLVDSLGAFQMKRYLDIYAATGAPAGDHDNTTVTFEKIDPSQFPRTLIGFCTVQDNTSFSADFRIAKTLSEADNGRLRYNCFAASFGSDPGECTSTLLPSAPEVPNATTKLRLLTLIHAPDLVNCSIISSSGNLEMRLVRIVDGAVVTTSGASFSYNTGKRSAIGGGFHQYYFIEVGAIAGTGTFPIRFGLRCTSGNGISDPLFVQQLPDDF